MDTYTLVYLVNDREICLGLKKRGFGEGKWNGFGGKVREGEEPTAAATRELHEECGVSVLPETLEKVAEITFFNPERNLFVLTYLARAWTGEPTETGEMRPEWFSFDALPYKEMWADDHYWLPRALHGEKLSGTVWFAENGYDIDRMEWKELL